MTSYSPALAIENQLLANWTATPVFADGNVDFSAPKDASGLPVPFVVLEFPGGREQQWTVGSPGSNIWREDGAFMLHVCVPTGTGSLLARSYTDQLAVIFRGQSFNFVRCWGVNPPVEGGLDGDFYSLSISVAYHYEFIA